MKTIKINLYKYNELTNEAKEKAIENIRESYYEYNDFANWAKDDCYLLNPPYNELKELAKNNFLLKDDILIKKNRNIYFSLDRNRYIDISEAMGVQDSSFFLQWLGIMDFDLIDKIDYFIGKDTIEILNQSDEDFTDVEEKIISEAITKFENHCEEILTNISKSIDYRFTDEAIIEDIIANEYDFLKDGTIYH